MARWRPSRSSVVGEWAAEVLLLFPRGRLVVGLDGVDVPVAGAEPSDREAFADDLVAAFRTIGAGAAAVRLGAYLASSPFDRGLDPDRLVDVPLFRQEVLQPFRAGRTVLAADGSFDPPERAVLVVSGAFAHTGDLAAMWHRSAWIQIPRAEAWQREGRRLDLPVDGPQLTAWSETVDRAFRRGDARKQVAATFDLADPEHPRRVFEDAC